MAKINIRKSAVVEQPFAVLKRKLNARAFSKLEQFIDTWGDNRPDRVARYLTGVAMVEEGHFNNPALAKLLRSLADDYRKKSLAMEAET